MSRPREPETRKRLLERAIDHTLENGIVGMSLRSLGRALGTSARMLVYHFGSREDLMREILAGLREREDATISAWLRDAAPARTLGEFVGWYWTRMGAREAEPALRLIFELYALALREPERFSGVLEDPVRYWRRLQRRRGSTTDSATATLLLAAVRGLSLDLLATGQRGRVNKAVALLCAMVDEHESGRSRLRRRPGRRQG